MKYVVETSSVTKRYGDIVAVDHLDFRVGEGEIYGLIGPNGAGKTTLIKILVGILRPDGGSALVLGQTPPHRGMMGRVGYMPQEMAIYQDLSVEENLKFFAKVYGLGGPHREERVAFALELVGLAEKASSLAMDLSGGMRHRLSLACALVHDPSVLFLDEPTVGVDPELRASFWSHFSELAAEGKTILITTHYMTEASECARVGMMHRGRLIAEGQPKDLVGGVGAESLEEAFLHYSRVASQGDGR